MSSGPRVRLGRFSPGAARKAGAKPLLIRFAFGAATSALAAVVVGAAGPVVGGTLLAAPAILLASLTLLIDEDGMADGVEDLAGALLGSAGLAAFALIAVLLFTRLAAPLVLLLAAAAWLAVGLGLYVLRTRRALRRVAARSQPPGAP